jgi:glutathione synthase/RimK-type ligase-like ATP-grasp enzyme
MTSNNSKPYQSLLIRAAGFRTPETLLTTDVQAVSEFAASHARIIYKSISGVRSIVRHLDVGDADRLSDVRWCPTQFQEYVPGTDYRVHVISTDTFVSRVISSAVDYRYASRDGARTSIVPGELNSEVVERCVSLTHSLGLVAAGIDLRVTDGGEVYCFEVNPSPGFTYYEQATGQPIAAAIAELLAVPRK